MNIQLTQPPAPPSLNLGTPFQRGLDSLIGTFAPGWHASRLQSRAKVARFQYAAAHSGRDRTPPQPLQSPDSVGNQMDGFTLLRRSQDLSRDYSFIGKLTGSYRIYALGNIQYIPKTSKKNQQAYRDYFDNWMKTCEVTTRFHFIDLMQLSLVGAIINGRHGLIHHHHDDGSYQLQAVPGYNIGNPHSVSMDPRCIRGVVINENGTPVSYQIFKLELSGQSRMIAEVPASIFSHINPVASTEEYAAKTPLHAVLGDAHDITKIEAAWLKKIQWAAYKTAIVNTSNGAAPAGLPFNNNLLDGGQVTTPGLAGKVVPFLPGETMYGDPDMLISMVENNTPNLNEQAMLESKMAQIAGALHLPLAFVWVMMGLPGTYTRLISEQAKRAFQHGPLGQGWLRRVCLDEIKNKALVSGIIRGEIPYDDNWSRGDFLFPAHPTVDVGRESDANLNENRQGIRSMSDITGEDGRYWGDVDAQLGAEAENKLITAINTAQAVFEHTGVPVTWQEAMTHIQMMSPNQPAQPTPKDSNEETRKPDNQPV